MEPYKDPYQGQQPELNWFDKQALAYQDWMFWFHLICCSCPGLIVALILLAGCKTEEGRNRSTKLLAFSALGLALGFVIRGVLRSR